MHAHNIVFELTLMHQPKLSEPTGVDNTEKGGDEILSHKNLMDQVTFDSRENTLKLLPIILKRIWTCF